MMWFPRERFWRRTRKFHFRTPNMLTVHRPLKSIYRAWHFTIPKYAIWQLWHKNMGSTGEDVALCSGTSVDHVAIAGFTTGDLYADNSGKDEFSLCD